MTWRTKIFYGDVLMFQTESPDVEYTQGAVNRFLDDKKLSMGVTPAPTGPVRTETVTKRRIVPGVYSRVIVTDEGKAGQVRLYFQGHCFGPDELDAAARTLQQLAEALRDD